jgi:hypothetical protein
MLHTLHKLWPLGSSASKYSIVPVLANALRLFCCSAVQCMYADLLLCVGAPSLDLAILPVNSNAMKTVVAYYQNLPCMCYSI